MLRQAGVEGMGPRAFRWFISATAISTYSLQQQRHVYVGDRPYAMRCSMLHCRSENLLVCDWYSFTVQYSLATSQGLPTHAVKTHIIFWHAAQSVSIVRPCAFPNVGLHSPSGPQPSRLTALIGRPRLACPYSAGRYDIVSIPPPPRFFHLVESSQGSPIYVPDGSCGEMRRGACCCRLD